MTLSDTGGNVFESYETTRSGTLRDTLKEMLWKNVLTPYQKLVGTISKTCLLTFRR